MANGATGTTPPYGPASDTSGQSADLPSGPYDPGQNPPLDEDPPYSGAFHPGTRHRSGGGSDAASPLPAGAFLSHATRFAGNGHAAASRTPATHVNGTAAAESRRFRSILGRFATGIVAVTAIDPETGQPTGMAANSFTSVSLDPALVSFCVAHTSTTWPKLRKAGRYCVNILSAPQRDVCLQLAAKGGDKFAGLGWTESPDGGPVLDGALAWLECEVEAEHVAGDHVIVVSRVHRLDEHHDGEPLIFFKGKYGRFEG